MREYLFFSFCNESFFLGGDRSTLDPKYIKRRMVGENCSIDIRSSLSGYLRKVFSHYLAKNK